MEHPLVRPSLAPYGFAFPNQAKRLAYRSPHDPYYVNPERLMAKFWAKRHRLDAQRPWPIETIVHEIMPGMAKVNELTRGEFFFGGKPYLSRDIVMLSTVVYWFGTNVGNGFLDSPQTRVEQLSVPPEREFLEKFRKRMSERDFVVLWAHTCVPGCNSGFALLTDSCCYNASEVLDRDYAIVEGLMRWLGKRAGREFIALWYEKLKRSREGVDQRRRADREAARAAA